MVFEKFKFVMFCQVCRIFYQAPKSRFSTLLFNFLKESIAYKYYMTVSGTKLIDDFALALL